NEVYAITGLKLKAQSPFELTMNIELANGSEGYIPPPEQHTLGGYTTWPARTAGLEFQAEPKIFAAELTLLEQVAALALSGSAALSTPAAEAMLAFMQADYVRLVDISGPVALHSSGHGRTPSYEGGFALFLPRVEAPGLSAPARTNRGVYLAEGSLKPPIDNL